MLLVARIPRSFVLVIVVVPSLMLRYVSVWSTVLPVAIEKHHSVMVMQSVLVLLIDYNCIYTFWRIDVSIVFFTFTSLAYPSIGSVVLTVPGEQEVVAVCRSRGRLGTTCAGILPTRHRCW